MDELTDSILHFLKSNILVAVLAMIGIGLVSLGVWQLLGSNAREVVVREESAQDVKGESDVREIVVDIQGAVKRPGVYRLSDTDRLNAAIKSAGGLTQDADIGYVAKNINLASKIQDGMKIYIPFEGEAVTASMQWAAGSAGSVIQASGLINVNSASESELDTLPGIGPATAAKIISLRPFGSVDELLSKKAVGASVFGKIKDKVTAP